jgi:rsbT co-antagonist protein RsbR
VNIPQMIRDGYIRDVHYQFVKKDGDLVDILISAIVVRNADGTIDRILGVLVDVTKRLKSESTLATQEEIIRALSCPLIPFGRGALLMPLIGHINPGRATRIVEELARGVVTQQATIAILDVTGVPNVDAEVADALLRAASVVRLLGADVMLTGIQPGIAKVIVELGIDMSGFTIKSSLREGLQLVMRNREWRMGNRVRV